MCILIVEDEPIVLMCATECFEAGGHKVMGAAHGRAAVRMIAANAGQFTALITDYNMPFGMTGGELIEHMRALYPRIPIMLTSGRGQEVTMKWKREHGVEFVPKPYDLQRMISRMEFLLAY